MTAFSIKVNESQHSCMLLTNKEIYLINQVHKPTALFALLGEKYLLYSFNTTIVQKAVPYVNSANLFRIFNALVSHF